MLTTKEAEDFLKELGVVKFRYSCEVSIYYVSLIPVILDSIAYYYQFEFENTDDSNTTFFAYDSANQFLGDLKLVSISLLDNDKIKDIIYKNY
tara:strand:+ start:135 stop:413 length:279 start_codon:yes stop_codon:yes gene_type:complete